MISRSVVLCADGVARSGMIQNIERIPGENPVVTVELIGKDEENLYHGDDPHELFKRPQCTIKNVIFNDPATVVFWSDGSKTVVKCQPNDVYDKETGLAMCIAKKFFGNKSNFNDVFTKWIPEEKKISVKEMRDKLEEFCDQQDVCGDCPLSGNTCRCGNGVHFKSIFDDGCYKMTDDEIKAAYAKVFEKG